MDGPWRQRTVTQQYTTFGTTSIASTVAQKAALMHIGSPIKDDSVFLTPPVSVTGLVDIWHDLHIVQNDCPLDTRVRKE